MPHLFRQRTNFGTRCESSLTLRQYDLLMRDAIQRVLRTDEFPHNVPFVNAHTHIAKYNIDLFIVM